MSSLRTLIQGSVLAERLFPTANIVIDPDVGVLGSVIKLDGRASSDPNGNTLSYIWSFESIPIGSKMITEGFRLLETDSSIVSFSPDVVGEYVIGLKVSNGSYSSELVTSKASIRAILVPHSRGIVPDGKFIWSYIRDVWNQVEGREWFETLWSALIQIAGSELLKLYEVDFNKSIQDIQDLYQRRWLAYEPRLELDQGNLSFYLGNHCAGIDAYSAIPNDGKAIIISPTEVLMGRGVVSPSFLGRTLSILGSGSPPIPANAGNYVLDSINPAKNGYLIEPDNPFPSPASQLIALDVSFLFTIQSTDWTTSSPADIRVGDFIVYFRGPNTGIYEIVSKTGGSLVVNRKPSSYSDAITSLTYKANVYRPDSFEVDVEETLLSDTFWIPVQPNSDVGQTSPGRVVSLGGESYSILRIASNQPLRVMSTAITTDESIVPTGLTGLAWRVPHTIVSKTQDFEELGVYPGDLLLVDVVQQGIDNIVTLKLYVVSVDKNKVGFVITDEVPSSGEIPAIPNDFFLSLSKAFYIDTVTENTDGTIALSDEALELYTLLNTGRFKETYWNTEKTPYSTFEVGSRIFLIKPKAIIRNRAISVDETLKSIPVLQQYIVQPSYIERDGKVYQVKNGIEYEIPSIPVVLSENLDFIIDNHIAFDGELSFFTGTNVIETNNGDFLDRGIGPGDSFIIEEPITLEGTYIVQAVIDNTTLVLTRPVPLYALSDFVRATVRIERRRTGHYIRMVPGRFSASNPAPDRLWAEVSFFDNWPIVESNFGLLVGLKREDLERASSDLNYRQAVAGLMYAYTQGPTIDKVRLGAQILLGLPFAENKGIIRSIEEDYRLDSEGNPVYGRIFIEDIDPSGVPMGTLRIYLYPIDTESELAGIEINPATGLQYAIGDTVERFAPLSKGVEVVDYLTEPLRVSSTPANFLQQFHTIRVRANDNIFDLGEIDLVSSFLKKITPSYITHALIMASEFVDEVSLEERLMFKISLDGPLVDNPYMGIPTPLKFDYKTVGGIAPIFYDSSVYWVRRTGQDLLTQRGFIEPTFGVPVEHTVFCPSNGFVNPRVNEIFEPPLTRAGDKIIIYGLNSGIYTIAEVADGVLRILDYPGNGFASAINQRFAIVRKLVANYRSGASSTRNMGSDTIILGSSLRTDGVASGDWLTIEPPVGNTLRFKVISVEKNPSSESYDRVKVTPASPDTGSDPWKLYRPQFFESPSVEDYVIESDGSNYLVSAEQSLKAILDTMDELQIQNGGSYRITVISPIYLYVTPAIPAGIYTVRLIKHRVEDFIGWDHIEKFGPWDEIELGLVDTDATAVTNLGSDVVTFIGLNPATDLLLRPGDYLHITSGPNSLWDIGYGLGVFPIIVVSGAPPQIKVVTTLIANDTASWKVIRRR